MSLYTIIGDPHAKPDNLDKIDQLFDKIEELGNDCIILGDLLDTKEVVRGKCLNKYIERIKQSTHKFYLLVGNHDWFNLSCEAHSLEPLKLLDNVVVVDNPLETQDFIAIPYMHDKEKLSQIVATFVTKKKPLFCHVDMMNFDYGNGFISEHGLTVKDFKGYPMVISGHYHKAQSEENFTYLGTPFSHSFGESNQEKYIGVYDSDNNHLDLFETNFPKHITVEIEAAVDVRTNLNPNDYNRVIIKGNKEDIARVPRISGIKYIERLTRASNSGIVIGEGLTPMSQFELWAKEVKKFSPDLIKKGLEILKDVQ